MKLQILYVTLFLLLMSFVSHAKTIHSLPEQNSKVDVFRVRKTVVLGKNLNKDITINAVEIYLGQSTDVSPKYRLYLTYFNGGEMNNTKTAFDLGYFLKLKSYERLKPGMYQISATRLSDKGFPQDVLITIDTSQVFVDDRNLHLSDFEDPYFLSTIQVTEK